MNCSRSKKRKNAPPITTCIYRTSILCAVVYTYILFLLFRIIIILYIGKHPLRSRAARLHSKDLWGGGAGTHFQKLAVGRWFFFSKRRFCSCCCSAAGSDAAALALGGFVVEESVPLPPAHAPRFQLLDPLLNPPAKRRCALADFAAAKLT